jgi:hypothetical protein
MKLANVISHARNRNYLNKIDRDYLRIKATGEVFTPLDIITKKLNDLENHDPLLFSDPSKTFLEPSCGDGNFLSEVLIRKIENGSTFEQALSTVYGVDLMPDNVDLCRERLLCGQEHLRHIVERNIVCADALKYHYRFDSTPCDVVETKAEKAARIKKEREAVKRQKEQEKLAKRKKLEAERAKKKAKLERERLKKQAKREQDRLARQAKREQEKLAKLAKAQKSANEKCKVKLVVPFSDLFVYQ